MTTTDQHAVTVAQEDREFAARWIVIAPENAAKIRAGKWDRHEGVKAAMRHRLASVSSASAEPRKDTVAFVQDWLMNADYDPTQFDKGFAAAIDARHGFDDAALTAIAERFCAAPLPDTVCADLVAIKPMAGRSGTNLMTVVEAKAFLRSIFPEPVPATNQAGEVERRVKGLLRGPDGEEYTDSGMEDAFFRWPVIANALNEALAGPVPTGEDVSAPSRIWLCGFDTDHGDISWSSCPNPADDPEVDGKQVEYVRSTVATTPTPTTRLEDLLAALRSWEPEGDDRVRPLLLAEADRREAQEYGVTDAHHVIAFLLHGLDAALATQPATSQEGEEPTCERCDRGVCVDPHYEDDDRLNRPAATPTPPTLSEDLRESLSDQLDDVDDSLRNGALACSVMLGKPQAEWLRAALAQVKAS